MNTARVRPWLLWFGVLAVTTSLLLLVPAQFRVHRLDRRLVVGRHRHVLHREAPVRCALEDLQVLDLLGEFWGAGPCATVQDEE